MVHDRIQQTHVARGAVVRITCDLSDAELLAVAHVTDAVKRARYAGVALDAATMLTMHALIALTDQALERAQDGDGGGTLVLTVDRLGLLVDSLREWLTQREQVGFVRMQQAIARPLVEDMLGDLSELYDRALGVALSG